MQQLERVHSPIYVEEIRRYAEAGGGRIEADTVLSSSSYDAALLAAGAAYGRQALTEATRALQASRGKFHAIVRRRPAR